MSEVRTAAGCRAGSVVAKVDDSTAQTTGVANSQDERSQSMIKVGKPAPDFEIPAYHKGEFTTVKLSEYKGKWVLVCFYPGDFTFV